MSKNITIKDLLARKEQLKNKKPERVTLFVESLDGNITIEQPTGEFCIETQEMAQLEGSAKADIHAVYNCMVEPNLKDPQLQKEFGCATGHELVELLFKPGEIQAISGYCLEVAGYGNGLKKVTDDLKN